jgi:hypothetical protein
MSHDAQHGHSTENKAVISFGNSFWLVIILVGLFIASVNFIQVESAGEGHEGGHGETTHETHHTGGHGAPTGHEATHEATEHPAEAAEPAAKEVAPATGAEEAAPASEEKHGH